MSDKSVERFRDGRKERLWAGNPLRIQLIQIVNFHTVPGTPSENRTGD